MRDVLTLINVFRKCRFEEPFIIDEIYKEPEPPKAKKVVKRTNPNLVTKKTT
jgi:hypothetical protein